MSAASPVRHAATEANWERDPAAVVWVGSRPVQHFWAMLAPYFRDVLLAPRRRAEDQAVTWQWAEPPQAPAPSAGEVRTLRRRLAEAQERFAENLARPARGSERAAPNRRQADLDLLVPVMARLTGEMIAWDDERLAARVCRAEGGWRLHTWGVSAPPTVRYPAEATPAPEAAVSASAAPPRRRRRVGVWLFATAALGVAVLWIRKEASPETRSVAREAEAPRVAAEATVIPADVEAGAGRSGPARKRSDGGFGKFGTPSAASEMAGPTATTVVVSSSARPPAGLTTMERFVPMPASLLAPGVAPGQAGAAADAPLARASVALPEAADVGSAQPSPSVKRGEISFPDRTAAVGSTHNAARLETRTAAVSVAGTVPPPGDDAPWSDERPEPLAEAIDAAENEATVKAGQAVGADASAAISRVPAALTQTLRVPWGAWRLRLVADAIVPTLPVPAGRAADTAAQRSRLRAERQARVPSALRAAVVRGGFDFERVDAVTGRRERWTWSADATAEPATDQGVRGMADRVPETVVELRYEAAMQTLVLRVADGVRVTAWFEVASMPRHWRWQTAAGAPLAAAGEARLAQPLRAGAEEASARRAVALVDPESGWGLVGGL